VNSRIKISLQWLLLAPAAALIISFASRYVLEYFSPGKLTGYRELITYYPLGLFLSLLSPWGFLMYGGLILMLNGKRRSGFWCSVVGGVILGLFWPIWVAFLK
jgi:hypothetical protein